MGTRLEVRPGWQEVCLAIEQRGSLRIRPGDRRLVGRALYLAPYRRDVPIMGPQPLDFRFRIREAQIYSDGWVVSGLPPAEWAGWLWTADGHFGVLEPVLLTGDRHAHEVTVTLSRPLRLLLAVPARIPGTDALSVVLIDDAYTGEVEPLIEGHGAISALRARRAVVARGQTAAVAGIWARPFRISLRSELGTVLWETRADWSSAPQGSDVFLDARFDGGSLVLHAPKHRPVVAVWSGGAGADVAQCTIGAGGKRVVAVRPGRYRISEIAGGELTFRTSVDVVASGAQIWRFD